METFDIKCFSFRLMHSERLEILYTDEIKRQPVRVIIKDTAVYRSFSESKQAVEMIPDELAQIDRGDIPHFYKNLWGEDLLFFAKDNAVEKVILADEITIKDTQRHGVAPQALLGSDRALQSKSIRELCIYRRHLPSRILCLRIPLQAKSLSALL